MMIRSNNNKRTICDAKFTYIYFRLAVGKFH